ncbi:MAG: suppressor of fused domain protein, partial [Jatrophihabitantaceae bacterium]
MDEPGGRDVLALVEAALQQHFGQVPARASVSFVGVDPIEILRFEPVPGERAYLSLGMARHPMTAATETLQHSDGPRAELMLHVRDPVDAFADVWRSLSVLAASPAVEGVVYAAGMTVDTGQPLAAGSRCTGGVLVASPVSAIPTPAATVDVLQLVPATSNELAWCRVQGSAALRDRWAAQGRDLLDLSRP